MSSRWVTLVCVACGLALLGSGLAAAEVPDPNVLWWTFDEGAGDVALDSSGNDREGVITEAEWKTGGVGGVGSCLEFFGTGQTVMDEDGGDYLNGMSGLTVAMWIKARSIPTDKGFINGEVPDGGDNVCTMRYDVAGASFGQSGVLKMAVTSDPGGEQQLESSSGKQTTEWQHVVMTWTSGGDIRFYADGVEDTPSGRSNAGSAGTISGCTALVIGQGAKDSGGSWDGFIDDVRIYGYALTPEQVTELYDLAKPMFLKASDPQPDDGAVDVLTGLLQWTAGDTATFHDVYLGTTPELTEADLVADNSVMTLYFHPTGVVPGTRYYWRVDEVEADTTTIHEGNVWTFLAQPKTAYLPAPENGSATVWPTATLNWLAGSSAISHQLYFGEDADLVAQGAADVDQGMLEETEFDPNGLAEATTYYWRVDEIGFSDAIETGEVWSFTTVVPVDGFEDYTDNTDEEEAIWQTWVDGFEDPANGSTVGYLDPANGTYGETTIVYTGDQSMPLDYNNVEASTSQATRMFSPARNWAAGDMNTLVLYVRGRTSNDEAPLYVEIRDTGNRQARVIHPDAAVVTDRNWTEWQIPFATLEDAGVNLSAVAEMVIGVGDPDNPVAGPVGLLYIDDIALAVFPVEE